MTNEQAAWLRAHPEFSVVGAGGAGQDGSMLSDARHFRRLLALHPDGRAVREKVKAPAILVGIKLTPAEVESLNTPPEPGAVRGGQLAGPPVEPRR